VFGGDLQDYYGALRLKFTPSAQFSSSIRSEFEATLNLYTNFPGYSDSVVNPGQHSSRPQESLPAEGT
jgi:hypothetical protein